MPLTILIADDEAVLRKVLVRNFEAEGYRVLEAADGEEALAEVQARQFDLVICDLKMPRVDGKAFYRALAQAKPALDAKTAAVKAREDAITAREAAIGPREAQAQQQLAAAAAATVQAQAMKAQAEQAVADAQSRIAKLKAAMV